MDYIVHGPKELDRLNDLYFHPETGKVRMLPDPCHESQDKLGNPAPGSQSLGLTPDPQPCQLP